MKWIDLLKTIKATRVSFIALILFISLSIGNLLGTGWSGPAVEILANRYYDDHAVMDFKAMSADSFDQNDVDKIRSLDDVADAEGAVGGRSCALGYCAGACCSPFQSIPRPFPDK